MDPSAPSGKSRLLGVGKVSGSWECCWYSLNPQYLIMMNMFQEMCANILYTTLDIFNRVHDLPHLSSVVRVLCNEDHLAEPALELHGETCYIDTAFPPSEPSVYAPRQHDDEELALTINGHLDETHITLYPDLFEASSGANYQSAKSILENGLGGVNKPNLSSFRLLSYVLMHEACPSLQFLNFLLILTWSDCFRV